MLVAYATDPSKAEMTRRSSSRQQISIKILERVDVSAYSDVSWTETDTTTSYGKEKDAINNAAVPVHFKH